MVVESLAILLLLLIIEVVFLRAKRREHAVQIAPLLILPAGHFLVNLVPDLIRFQLTATVKTSVDVLCLAIAVSLLGIFSVRFTRMRTRAAYLLTCGGFTVILGLIFIYNNYVG